MPPINPTETALQIRWQNFTAPFPAPAPIKDAIFETLLVTYRQSFRKFHTIFHIKDALDRLDEVPWRFFRIPPWGAARAELAVWFHDFVYSPSPTSNAFDGAIASGDAGRNFATMLGLNHGDAEWIRIHIRKTAHIDLPSDDDSELVCDIDLAPLGYDWATFSANEALIRDEFPFLSLDQFKTLRRTFLEYFNDKPFVYHTKYFQSRFELQARQNIEMRLVQLAP